MKKNWSGILILLIAFVIGFAASPINFINFAVKQTGRGWFTTYYSNYFVKLTFAVENYHTSEEVEKAFERRLAYIETLEILELEQNRAITSFWTKKQLICIIRKEKNTLFKICSNSLRHVLEFEKQKFPEN